MHPRCALLTLVALAASATAYGQTRTVGSVGEIAAIGVLQQCAPNAQGRTVAAVRVRRSNADTVLYPGQTAQVYVGDEFRVHQRTDVRLWINSDQFGHGAVILAPELLCPVFDVDTTIPPYSRADSGSYRISTTERDVLRLGVLAGGAFIQWNSPGRQLVVVAGNHVMIVKGTELVILADSSGTAALLYVREGSVAFPNDAGLRAHGGQIFELRSGRSPRAIGVGERGLLRTAEANVAAHARLFPDVPIRVSASSSTRPWWRHPITLAAASAIAGGAIGYCSQSDTHCGITPKKAPRQTTVIVRLPF